MQKQGYGKRDDKKDKKDKKKETKKETIVKSDSKKETIKKTSIPTTETTEKGNEYKAITTSETSKKSNDSKTSIPTTESERKETKYTTKDDNSYKEKEIIPPSKYDKLLNNVYEEHGITKDPNLHLTQFNRFKRYEYLDFLSIGGAYIFMTKPNLNLRTSELLPSANNGLPQFFIPSIPKEIGDASSYISKLGLIVDGVNPFVPLITNQFDNFDTKDISVDTDTAHENYQEYKQIIAKSITSSLSEDKVGINYIELLNMEITTFHQIWVQYIEAVKKGTILPSLSSLKNKEIDYMSSIYFFLVGPDGMTIKYFCKLTGVFPVNIPYSAFSFNSNDSSLKKLNIQYQYSVIEHMDFNIISDFNRLSEGSGESNVLGNTKHDNWAKLPIVVSSNTGFQLRFK